ncbi:MAG: hypothetical protein K6E13_09920 [Lachnospiraceae bacterium]|nr:hypothetical protein [Lachnospiraceae bacterium]
MEIAKIVRTTTIILILLAIVVGGIRLLTKKVYYPTYSADDISRIIVEDVDTGSKLNIVNPEDIERIVNEISGMELKVEGQGIVTPSDSYELTVYNSEGLEIVDFNPILVVDNDSVQKEPLCYKILNAETLYDDIKALFEATEEDEENIGETEGE